VVSYLLNNFSVTYLITKNERRYGMHNTVNSLIFKDNHQKGVMRILQKRYLINKLRLTSNTDYNAGFSLLELIVVVVIVGILAAIVGPGWLGFVNRQRVNKANDAVLGALQDAQKQAKKIKRNYSVSFAVDNGVPKFSVYPNPNITNPPPPLTSSLWKTLGEGMEFKQGQVLIYSNLTSYNPLQTTNENANKKSADTVNYNTALSNTAISTITFDYMGVLAPKFDKTAADTVLKIAVATPKIGSAGTAASELKRCVFIETLIGGMRIGKNETECNQ
jgi:prepilin-type N-terminal cleavage/methylation domain-containing protein